MIGRRSVAALLVTAGAVVGGSVATGFAASLTASARPLTAMRTCTVIATPSTTTAVADASVRQGSATSNFGATTTMDVASGSAANRRIYIRFDLTGCAPSVPASGTIRAATLRLYVTSLASVCRTIDIFRVTTAWTESTITWNNQPFGTTVNNPASTSRTDSFDVGTPTGCENRVAGYTSGAAVATDLAAFISGTTNYGWMLRDDTEGSGTTRTSTFSAKELASLSQAPQLVVTYVTTP
jgi:hypothetical protein